MLERAKSPITGDCCINRVPFDIRLLNQDAYTPKVVSIGPFHHHNPTLQNMERHKLIYFNKFLELGDVNLESLVIHVKEAEPNFRRSYADTLDLTKEELVKIILVDSCFIIELFWRFYYNEWLEGDVFFLTHWLTTKIRLNLLLIENQLFFALENLFNRAFISDSDYFAYYNSCNLASDNIIIRHFTYLLRMFHLQQPIERRPPNREEPVVHLHSASESQCHYPYESYITDCVVVLDFLINTNIDVDALIQNDVLVNWLDDTDSVTNVYNGLWKNITHLNFSSHYIHLYLDTNAFCSVVNYMDVVNDIKGMLERAESPITCDFCIYKVPFDIHLLNEDVYTPKVVSIGPFHHHNPTVQNMERHKLIYFNKFLELFVILVIHVEEAEPNFRRSYADTLDLTKEELVKIILILFYNEWSEGDAFLLKHWLTTKIRLDLLLIENQLPFFNLESLYNRALSEAVVISLHFLSSHLIIFSNLASDNIIIRHFTKLLRMFHLRQPIERRPHCREEYVVHLHIACELVEVWVRFKVNTKTKVEDCTELLFRNFVALEQCHYPYESYITDFVVVLDFLINTNRDVDALIQNVVLVKWLGDTHYVTNVYNGLWKNITHLNFSSHNIHLCLDLNAFCSLICLLCAYFLRNQDIKCLESTEMISPFMSSAHIIVIPNTRCCLVTQRSQNELMDVVNDIKGMLEMAESPITCDFCIYRVPFDIRLLNQDAYTPKVVSIGPFHHHNPTLQNMERHKLIYFNKFLELGDVNLESLVIHVEEAEPNFRRSYADTLDLTKEELVKIILVDSCFIIELFWRFYYNEWLEGDVFFLKHWLTTKIRLNLLLIENQLFFALENLFNRAFISDSDYFAYYNSCNLASDNIIIRHFTYLLRMFHLQQPIERRPLVEKNQWCIFIVLQCHYPYESYITDCVVVLDFLINTNIDVDALIQNDVLVNWLGDIDYVTNVYNGLWKNITHLNFSSHYIHLCLDLNAFCNLCILCA
ncbi:hypothetical protein Lal_00024108 [Lupinus albus]|nr:hypothetical protein Lal_00024108 [Lupinus albus]